MDHLLVEKPVGGKVGRAEVGRHVGLHQVHIQVLVQDKVEPDHLEEGVAVRVVGHCLKIRSIGGSDHSLNLSWPKSFGFLWPSSPCVMNNYK